MATKVQEAMGYLDGTIKDSLILIKLPDNPDSKINTA